MTIPSGARLGPYQILGPLGAGGIGEVYRARDTRLGRTVAIKTLPSELSRDSERRLRFERETKAIAALNHPHICTLHDVGHHDGVDFLVMELIEGETLAARLERGPLEITDALSCGIQIASALDAAHRRGIVHRDLKPGNIMLARAAGARQGPVQVKLLDFGLARLHADGAAVIDGATNTAPLTGRGEILGTLPYMAPEQLEGREVDARTDLFAFGAILHEMVTGRRAFDGASQAGLIGAILHRDPPPLARLTPGAPPALERLVAVCLSKDPSDRWSTAHDVLLQLKGIADAPATSAPSGVAAVRRRDRVAWIAVLLAAVAALALGAILVSGRVPGTATAPELAVLSILPPEGATLVPDEAPQISPDGRRVAFVATDESGRRRLYIRSWDEPAARYLEGIDDAAMPFWAPDGRRLGFFAQAPLKTVSLAGGSTHTIARAPVPRGGTWSRDDVILFVGMPAWPPHQVPAGGGEPRPVPLPDGVTNPRRSFPVFLPDGRQYLYLAVADNRPDFSIRVGSLTSPDTVELVRAMAAAGYAGPGYLLFRREQALVAQPFDERTLRLTGAPVMIAENVGYNPITYQGLFSVAGNGVVAYQDSRPASQLVWHDREGRPVGAAGQAGNYNTVCLTAGGRTVAYEAADPMTGVVDIWALEHAAGVPSRLTFGPNVNFYPVCSSSRGGGDLRRPAAGPAEPVPREDRGSGQRAAGAGVSSPEDSHGLVAREPGGLLDPAS